MKLRVLLTLVVSAVLGCASPTDDATDADGAGEDALTTKDLPNVAAISIGRAGEEKTVGSKKKVEKVLKAFKKPGGATPRCAPTPATQITLFDKDAKTIGTGSVFCFLGSITVKGRTTRIQ